MSVTARPARPDEAWLARVTAAVAVAVLRVLTILADVVARIASYH